MKPHSRSCCKRIHKGKKQKKKRISSYRGYYKGIKCDSRWELAFLIYHLDKGKTVVRCDKFFTYKIGLKEHKYFPDFMIGKTIIEVKGKWKKNLQVKLQCVISAGYTIKLIDEKKIKPYLKYCYKKFGTEHLEKLYDKKVK